VSDVSPVRRGRHVTLRPLRPPDYEVLYDIALFTDAGSRWRLHGDMPPFDQFVQILLRDARVTFAIEKNTTAAVLGMAQLWNYDPLSRNAHLTAFLDPAVQGRGWPLEGILLFVDYVFPAFNLHKLYFESLTPQLATYGSLAGTFLRKEAELHDHRWVHGGFQTAHILALYADDVPRLLRLLRRGTGTGTAPASGSRPHPHADAGLAASVEVNL
jgi:RimJ/RimL family protein N-acetyltransferase